MEETNVIIGFNSLSKHKNCFILGDNCFTTQDNECIIGTTLFGNPLDNELEKAFQDYEHCLKKMVIELVNYKQVEYEKP